MTVPDDPGANGGDAQGAANGSVDDTPGATGAAAPSLRRELGLFEVVVYGVGLILGAGIYAILGAAAGVAGESVPLAFLLAAVVASFTGLSYAELSSRFPRGEGDYVYVREAFDSKRLAEVVAVLRVFVGVVSTAAVAIAFAGYLSGFASVSTAAAALVLVLIASAVNYWGIDLSAKLNIVFTAAEIAGLAVVIWVGTGTWDGVDVFALPSGGLGIVEATFLVFFAYLGFGSIVTVAEETEDPTRTVPRAVVLAIVVTTVLYVMVAFSAVGLVDPTVLGASGSPLALVAEAGGGAAVGSLVGAIALTSTANTVLILLVSTSRLTYGVSKSEYRSFPTVFSRIHPKRRTPHLAIALVAALAVPFVLLDDLVVVAGLANASLLLVFVAVNGALVRLRFEAPEDRDGFTAPLTVGRVSLTAVLGVLTSVGLLVFYLASLA
ncbi:APC family permease [Halobaculum roseum]|uniref:APC family permease n=1 Tax=Halobaculum roseum TaxID=2175149 RepID=A0ABD5MQ38_9EURY|nr:amino acid permease [Halobaculum roseum]QZY04639.1 amino acid permease [Halobaculum roseum]